MLLKLEEDWVRGVCNDIAQHKPDVVVTEKGLSDLALHFLTKAGISAIRRLRKTDNNRIARATGATIVHRRAPQGSALVSRCTVPAPLPAGCLIGWIRHALRALQVQCCCRLRLSCLEASDQARYAEAGLDSQT